MLSLSVKTNFMVDAEAVVTLANNIVKGMGGTATTVFGSASASTFIIHFCVPYFCFSFVASAAQPGQAPPSDNQGMDEVIAFPDKDCIKLILNVPPPVCFVDRTWPARLVHDHSPHRRFGSLFIFVALFLWIDVLLWFLCCCCAGVFAVECDICDRDVVILGVF